MINYTELKEAMTDLGYKMSAGNGWTAADDNNYRSYLYLNHTGINTYVGKMGHQYTPLLPDGFPGTGDSPEPGPDAELVSIAISGYTDTLNPEGTVQLTATGTYDDEATADVTADAEWTSSDEEVATVDGGLVTAVGAGEATITATVGEVSGTQSVTVEAAEEEPELIGVEFSSSKTQILDGRTEQIIATATYDDESTEDVTAQVTDWVSSDEEVGTVDENGLFTAENLGSTSISGKYNGEDIDPIELEVIPA